MKSALHKTDFAGFCQSIDPQARCVRSVGVFPQSLADNTRNVSEKAIFFALKGVAHDGRDYIRQAVQSGASWIVTDNRALTDGVQDHLSRHDVGLIQSPDPRRLMAKLAAQWFVPQPSKQILVTGTNGKTSVVDYIRQLGALVGQPSACIGTLGVRGINSADPQMMHANTAPLTSPDSITLHRLMAGMVPHGVDTVALEASSHGLEQQRLAGTTPDQAVFTGLGRDHLDYHQSIECYLAAKMRLFQELLNKDGLALCAAQTQGAETVQKICAERGIRCLDYGTAKADFSLHDISHNAKGTCFTAGYQGQRIEGFLPLLGQFQLCNALAAVASWVCRGIDFDMLIEFLGQMQPVDGRLECVGHTSNGAAVYVDYAHTPDALFKVLHDIRPHTKGKIWLVFGCGGDRDQGKRPQMGAIAARYADHVVITDDNPRSEKPCAIRAAISASCPSAYVIGDRQQAIALALEKAGDADVVIVAGKGHEVGQTIGDQVIAFDDRLVAKQLLAGAV